MSQETKEKISKRLKGHPSFMNGYTHSEEIKKRISKSHKGKHYSVATEFKKGHKGFPNSHSFKKGETSGSKNINWKNGQCKKSDGRILILKPSHPRADCKGYVRRSHLVMEAHLGRYLTEEEVVHHKEKKDDDRIEMLKLFTNHSSHMKSCHPKKSTPNRKPSRPTRPPDKVTTRPLQPC